MSDRTESPIDRGSAVYSQPQWGTYVPALVEEGASSTLDSGVPAAHCAVYTPRSYESGYAYPLVVWFHDEGGDERDVLSWLPQISDQNYLGIGLRAPLPVTNGLPTRRRWSTSSGYLDLLEDELAVSLCDLADRLNVHPERIVVAGVGQGATVALRMLLRRPEWFAAGVCLNADWLPDNRLEWWGQYTGKPLWLGHAQDWPLLTSRSAIQSSKLLRSGGFDVTQHFDDFDELRPMALAREVNNWLMHRLIGETLIA